MKKIFKSFLLIILIINCRDIFGCKCLYNLDLENFTDYKQVNNAFICKIIKSEIIDEKRYITAEITTNFKGENVHFIKIRDAQFISTKIKVYSDCDVDLEVGNKFLIVNCKYKNEYSMSYCVTHSQFPSKQFYEDSLFLAEFGKLNGEINTSNCKGKIVNGLPEGEWLVKRFRSYSIGSYKNGLKNGRWVEFINFSNKLNVNPKTDTLWHEGYYVNDTIESYGYSYSPNGKVSSKAKYKKGRGIDSIINYTQDGKLSVIDILDNKNNIAKSIDYSNSTIEFIMNNVFYKQTFDSTNLVKAIFKEKFGEVYLYTNNLISHKAEFSIINGAFTKMSEWNIKKNKAVKTRKIKETDLNDQSFILNYFKHINLPLLEYN